MSWLFTCYLAGAMVAWYFAIRAAWIEPDPVGRAVIAMAGTVAALLWPTWLAFVLVGMGRWYWDRWTAR